jgi:hypothetical protein
MSRETDGLLARIRQVRRGLAPPETATPGTPSPSSGAGRDQLEDLRARVAHLEQLAEGLQDSVYREAQRQDKRITDLEMRIEPAALASALSKDARERGL